MEYCGAGSASDLMNSIDKTYTEPQIAAICASVLNGLSYLHKNHNIHRDLKSGNILMSSEGHAKLGTKKEKMIMQSYIFHITTAISLPSYLCIMYIQLLTVQLTLEYQLK
jgi:serine/threonine protein kinase